MRTLPVAAAVALALATPSLVHAQDAAPPAAEPALAEMSEKLADPQFQAQAAAMVQVLVGSMLDLKVGPIAEAINNATDGQGPDVDPDARLRDLSPDAEEIPDQVADRLPQAMNAMSAMSEGMQTMLPALREMAERMRGAIEGVQEPR
ncbi:MAG: hypothetical protein AAFQ27_07975 [Pseudomonadota bacterium]